MSDLNFACNGLRPQAKSLAVAGVSVAARSAWHGSVEENQSPFRISKSFLIFLSRARLAATAMGSSRSRARPVTSEPEQQL